MLVFGKHEVQPIDEVNLEGKLVVIDYESLAPAYRDKEYQVGYAWGGFGCSPVARGRLVLLTNLADGEEFAVYRHEVIGTVEESELSPNQWVGLEYILDGDMGKVNCGRCGTILRRKDAFLHDRYDYTCLMCEDELKEEKK